MEYATLLLKWWLFLAMFFCRLLTMYTVSIYFDPQRACWDMILKSKLTISTVPSLSLFHFKSNVLEYRRNTTKTEYVNVQIPHCGKHCIIRVEFKNSHIHTFPELPRSHRSLPHFQAWRLPWWFASLRSLRLFVS